VTGPRHEPRLTSGRASVKGPRIHAANGPAMTRAQWWVASQHHVQYRTPRSWQLFGNFLSERDTLRPS
jgi:hypothetical protein